MAFTTAAVDNGAAMPRKRDFTVEGGADAVAVVTVVDAAAVAAAEEVDKEDVVLLPLLPEEEGEKLVCIRTLIVSKGSK